MPSSVPMKKAMNVAARIDSNLVATDPRFEHTVGVVGFDGTTLWYQNAFALTWTDPDENTREDGSAWIMVFTEHYGTHVFAEDELHGVFELSPVDIGLAIDPGMPT